EHFVTERADIDIPDYSLTLGEMKAEITALAEEIEDLASQPALELTPETLAQQIRSAGVKAREEEHAIFRQSTDTFVALGREMGGLIASARTEQQQFKMQLWYAGGGIIMGVILCLMFTTIPNRLAPESWHWPEKAAAGTLGRDMWNAGARMMMVANPQEWDALVAADHATQGSRAALAGCLKAATRGRKEVRCAITVRPDAS
ncbi:MAG: hypothetical protein KGJ05_04735, partial [Alphaproteobacteria bacterium]|nr:hypothetical protein [Alphaproteobacteria bacterium]